MRNRRLTYRFASYRYAHRRWPHGRALMPSQLSPEIGQLSLYDCCLMAGLSAPRVTRHHTGISHQAIKRVAKAQSRLMRTNAYHNHAHIRQVILAAGLLAEEAALSQTERDIVIVAALIHDFGHMGAKRHKTPLWQETLSCDKALPHLIRGGMDSRLAGLFYEMILATSPKAEAYRNNGPSDDILSVLLDADLFASLFLSKRVVDRLTAQLKYEDRLTISVAELRDNFLAICQAKGLSSLAGQALHERLSPQMTYFQR